MERAELVRRLGVPDLIPVPPGSGMVVEERDPAKFMAAFAAAVGSGQNVFLADPAWGESERATLAQHVARRLETGVSRGWLMIPSGGTSGRLKFARHDGWTIAAAVRGYGRHFRVERVNNVGVLPLHHVSGLMAWMRSVLTGGSYRPWDWKRLEAGERPDLPPGQGAWFLSLVPTQLQRLLAAPGPETVAWLRQFEAIAIGGGPLWPELAEQAARAGLPLSPGYGLTETAAMVAAVRPGEFLAGIRGSGAPLPHVRLELTDEGLIRIAGESVCRGYFPDWNTTGEFTTDDLGRLDEHGRLHLLGRRDFLIITGGEKVNPLEVEAVLQASGEFADVAVVGIPDPTWGQAVVACYPQEQRKPDPARLAPELEGLAAFKRPRRYLAVAGWPRNAQGKLNRSELARRAAESS